ncbi:MAG: ArsR/SmtB family transcription factor [Sandaracinaceae bacterium]
MPPLDLSAPPSVDALGSSTRRAIVQILATRPRAVGEIADRLPISRPAVSKHLRVLEEASLVQHERRGNRHVFRLDRQGFAAARRWLDAFWDEALDRFRAVAESDEPVP